MITVLYVDADPKMCPLLSHIFEQYWQISEYPADSGETAIAWLSRYHADVIVSGYYLPAMNGIELYHLFPGNLDRILESNKKIRRQVNEKSTILIKWLIWGLFPKS